MHASGISLKPDSHMPTQEIVYWRFAQAAVWLAGAGILFCLLFIPSIGVLLFWNILIPVAPALFVVATGIWRNVCPLATTNLLPRHLGLSKRKKLSVTQLGILNLIAVIALYIIVPLRHAVFNNNGFATGLLILSMVLSGMIMGFFFEWKSAWCSGLCPVHPVEKLYGGNVFRSMTNAHCDECMNCVIPCPDSTPHIHPGASIKTSYHRLSGSLIVGGLPGFIWGWFHVPDEATISNLTTFFSVYKMPLLGLVTTLIIYQLLLFIIRPKYDRVLINIFAATGVSCYYWYRIPSLFGFGKFANDGLLVNLTNHLPEWMIVFITCLTTIFFFYWLVFRKQNNISWIKRPAFADKK